MPAPSNGPATGAAVVWRSRAVRLALAAFPLWCTASLLLFNAPWRFRLLVGALFGLSAAAPHLALVALAAVVPLGHLIEVALRLQPFRVTEAVVLAFFAGWLVRDRADHDGPRVPGTAGWLLAIVICASVVVQTTAVTRAPGQLLDNLQVLYQAYYLIPDGIGFGAAALVLEGLGLMAAAATLFRGRPRLADTLPVAMVASAVVAAASSVLLTRGIAFAAILSEHARLVVRSSAHVSDPNAAASYFSMILFVALGMAARRLSFRSVLWLAAAATQVAALVLAGSRTGAAVVVLAGGVAAAGALSSRWRPRTRAAMMATVFVLVVAGGLTRAWTLRADPGTSFRQQFFATSLRMIADRPVLGLGIGRYYDTSPLYLSPEMAWLYGFQNAPNYFAQIAAEIGLVGLLILLAVIGSIVFRAARAAARSPGDMRLLGCTAGVGAMLTTWLTGHPMRLPEVAYPFWILLGLVAGIGGSVLIGTGESSRKPERFAGARAMTLAILAVGFLGVIETGFGRRPVRPSASPAVTGLEPWETSADGTRFRWTHEYASVFVPSNATRVYIPVRLPVDPPRLLPMSIDIEVGGVYRGRSLVGTDWAILNLELPPVGQLQRFKRIDLKIQRTWQPAVYLADSSDFRKIGVQVGEIKEFYEY